MAAGLATVRAYKEEKIFEKGAAMEQTLRKGLLALAEKHRVIGEVRGAGAFFAIELA